MRNVVTPELMRRPSLEFATNSEEVRKRAKKTMIKKTK
jgi:hypothetical protein